MLYAADQKTLVEGRLLQQESELKILNRKLTKLQERQNLGQYFNNLKQLSSKEYFQNEYFQTQYIKYVSESLEKPLSLRQVTALIKKDKQRNKYWEIDIVGAAFGPERDDIHEKLIYFLEELNKSNFFKKVNIKSSKLRIDPDTKLYNLDFEVSMQSEPI